MTLLVKIRSFIALVFLTVLVFTTSQAIERVSVSVEKILIPLDKKSAKNPPFINALNLNKLDISLDILADPMVFKVSLKQFNLPEPYKQLEQFEFSCQSLDIQAEYIQCQGKSLSINGLFNGETTATTDFNIHYSFIDQTLKASIQKLNIGQGSVSLTMVMDNKSWNLSFEMEQLDFKLFEPYLQFHAHDLMKDITDTGMILSVSGKARGDINGDKNDPLSGLKQLDLKGMIRDLRYTMVDDMADNVSFNFSARITHHGMDKTAINLSLAKVKGEVYQNEIYLELSGREKLELDVFIDKKTIKIKKIQLKVNKLLDLYASVELIPHKQLPGDYTPGDFYIAYTIADLDKINRLYLQNILEGTDYEGVDIEGGLKGYFGRNGRKMQFNNVFKQFSMDFNGQIMVLGLNGELNWNNHKSAKLSPVSQLNWQELQMNELPFGATKLRFVSYADRLSLLEETDVPLFDGALHINSLEMKDLGKGLFDGENVSINDMPLTITIDGMIKPVSLSLVSEHFDWPILDGKVSAVIPQTTYNSHLLTVGGALMMQVFDGAIIVKDLKIERPLDDNAGFYANIDLMNVDLQSLTKTFNFGEIQGRMEGKIQNIQLIAWKPVAFDAWFKTPENDDSRHKISQRAIDNLSSLGGASGILSRSFLSIFKNFSYSKIGLSCRLKNNTCYMNGVEKKGDNAYYIVKGSGLPRIDVVGFQRAVNWQVLLSRLRNIQSANEPIIE